MGGGASATRQRRSDAGASRLGYVPALDGLRGIAVVAVVGFHAYAVPFGGYFGVDLFFVLSGFLITTLLLEERAARGRIDVADFYRRRARRLLPALAALLLVYLVLDAAKGNDGLVHVAEYGLYDGNVYIGAFAPHAGVSVLASSGLGHLWSLAEEEQFYLLWPLLLLALARRARPVRWLVGLLLLLTLHRLSLIGVHANGVRIAESPDTRSTGLVVGCALAFLRRRSPALVPPGWAAALAATAAAACFVLADGSLLLLPLFELAAAVLVLAAVGGGATASALGARPLVWLGRISYGLYLWHYMLLWAFGRQDRPLAIALAVAAAYASHRWIETPLRRRGRRAGRPVGAPSPAPA